MPKIIRNKKIGIFDSGFGGLNIMRAIVKELPAYDFIYLGDTARVPYGSRSQEVVYGFAKQAVDFLFEKKCNLIIFACNTVSSKALRKIQQIYIPKFYHNKKVLGVLIPAIEFAALKTKNKKIGVLATEGTVSSGAFIREIQKINPEIKIFQNACPSLVPIIEAGKHNSKETEVILKKYSEPLLKKKIDTLILGCTHYGILEKKIKKIFGKDVQVISGDDTVAKKLKDYLKRHPEIEKTLVKKSMKVFYSTDPTKNFHFLGSKFFGQKIKVLKATLK